MSPTAPKHPCSVPGCAALLPRGTSRCELHPYQRPDGRKPFEGAVRTADRAGGNLYGSSRWKTARATWLKRNPTCTDCGGEASTVDHEPPFTTSEEFWQTWRWFSRCAPCHNSKSARLAALKAQQNRKAKGESNGPAILP